MLLGLFAALFILAACEKGESEVSNLENLDLLSVGVEGETSLLLSELTLSLDSKSTTLSSADETGLLHMREEEKLAHDLYAAYAENYDLRIFSNITLSEANHMEAVLVLLENFGLTDPASPDAGVFDDASLQSLYNDLLASGQISLVDALKNGAYVEEIDILDLEKYLELSTDESITLVYSNLLRASRNHLRAFARVLSNNGVTYEPQVMSVEYYQEIINSDMEQGGKGQKGRYGYRRACNN